MLQGEVITLDWPGIELVSRLVSEMGGGWQLHGDANKLKEDTFRVPRAVCACATRLSSGCSLKRQAQPCLPRA